MHPVSFIHHYRVKPGDAPELAGRDPGAVPDGLEKPDGLERLTETVERIAALHTRLYAEGTSSVLLVLQGMDASGKDGTIRHVLTDLNPQGCRVESFREPSSTELAHDYLWRIHARCPARGELALFNRSHYEDVVAVRVRELVPRKVWERRYRQIRAFERMLVDEGTRVVKVFLHVSPEKQRERLQERVDNPEKRWKFQPGDLDDRALWDPYVEAYEDAIRETSTEAAPWYVVPADRNWLRNLSVAQILLHTLEQLDPQFPEPAVAPSELEVD